MHPRPVARPARRLAVLLAACAAPFAALAQPLGTGFTYQGQLTESGQPPNGLYDIQVCLFDSPSNPATLACAPDFNDVPVEDGVFTLALDFGAAPFTGQQRFLELRVRPGASTGGYTILSPRQLVRPTPEALRATAASAAPWSGLTGVPAGFADGIDNDSGGTVTSVIAGTGLSGGTITGSGTIAIAPGGVGPTQIAPGAVGPTQLAPAAVRLAQIDTSQVQARISGSCAVGEYFRGVNADGTVACEPVPGVPRITVVDDPANAVGEHTSIAIGIDGRPVISYYDLTADALKVAQCANAACTGIATITTVDDGTNNVGEFSDIAVGADGLPVISYHDGTAGTLKVAKCANAACTGAATITTVDDPANFVGAFTSIAIGGDGLPVISYYDITATNLKVAKCANAACTGTATITTVDPSANDVGRYTSIAIGNDGLPVISYLDATSGDLKAAQCANAACTGSATISIVDGLNTTGVYSSIAIGGDGTPVISYQDATLGALKVARCQNPSCAGGATTTVVDDPVNSVGFFTSIAVGNDGIPVVSHHDLVGSSLRVVRCANAACTGPASIVSADDRGIVGAYTSIAIGTDGLPVISYFDQLAIALKVAKCGTRSCQ